MGRYYDTTSGRGGKFGFAVQDSDDPEYMGMLPENCRYYFATEEEADNIKEIVDGQYDKLNVPDNKRIYYMEQETTQDSPVRKLLNGLWKDSGEDKDKLLAVCRIELGLVILSDIKDNGQCSLRAELY